MRGTVKRHEGYRFSARASMQSNVSAFQIVIIGTIIKGLAGDRVLFGRFGRFFGAYPATALKIVLRES
jgi:hypothetical protein